MSDGARTPAKVAITGATGFVGRHVVARLEALDVPIVVVARPSSTLPAAFAKHETVRLDLRDAPDDAFERLHRPDALIHLAWGGLPNYSSAHHVDEELPAQMRFLTAMVRGGLRQLFVSGTCAEYGMRYGPLRETEDPCPNTPYASAKDAVRRRLESLRASHPFALTWGRLFYLTGTGQGPRTLLSQLRAAVERGDTEFPMSGGEQLRDYLPIETAADHIVRLALSGHDHGIVNVCSGRPISVRRLVEELIAAERLPIKPRLAALEYPPHESMAFWGDREKLDACLAQL